MTRALGSVALGSLLALVLWPLAGRLPNFLIPDDGYFYARIALNLATLGRSTFDGIHTTSGYHLPWAFVLAAIARVVAFVSVKPEVHLLAYLALSLSIIVATVRAFFDAWLFRACAFVLLVASFSLTEMALAAPLLLALLRASTAPKRPIEPWLAGALALVRVDLVCVPLVLAALLARDDRVRAVRLAAAAALGAVLQLVIMKLAFGHFVSVAALLKTEGAFSSIGGHVRYNLGVSAFQALLYAAHAALATLTLLLRRDRGTRLLVVGALAFLVLHTPLSILRGWYWVPSSIGLLFAVEHALRESPARPRVARVARAAVAVLGFAFVVHSARVELLVPEQGNV